MNGCQMKKFNLKCKFTSRKTKYTKISNNGKLARIIQDEETKIAMETKDADNKIEECMGNQHRVNNKKHVYNILRRLHIEDASVLNIYSTQHLLSNKQMKLNAMPQTLTGTKHSATKRCTQVIWCKSIVDEALQQCMRL